jgi:tetratricopeptide (TPR) repeat protein
MAQRYVGWRQLFLVVWLVLPCLASAQDELADATRALHLGDFDRVEALVGDSTDPQTPVLLALADVGRGRYTDAEARLVAAVGAEPAGDAALELALLRFSLGQRFDARLELRTLINRSVPSTAADFLRLGRAAQALGEFDAANTYLRRANAVAMGDPAVNTAWGELFLARHQNQEAFDSFEIALETDPDYVPAKLGEVRVFLQDNPPQARDILRGVREANADNVAVLLIDAELAIDDRDRGEAAELLARVREVNSGSLEAYALAAALAFLEGREADFETEVRGALAINPVYGEVYRVAGDHAARNYLFTEAVDLTREALAIDPDSTAAYANLGMHLLRTGDEMAAREALERAFEADASDVITFNLLTLLDTLDTFVTVEEGDLIMRFAADEAAVLREYAMPLAQEALDTLSGLYGFSPEGPILIEVFPRHDDFAVRTLGLPGFLGALGACFGSVVTMDSPTARPPGTFSWEATLWHELAHVMTLQMSNNRVPRWLSEGVSVFEERRARPEWGRETLVRFAQALAEDELIPLADLNPAFTNPETISLAYFQSSVVVDHVIDEFGEAAFYALVRSYGEGLETDEAIEQVLGVTLDGLQDSFDAYLERTYADLVEAVERPAGVEGNEDIATLQLLVAANPRNFGMRMLLAVALREAGDSAAALEHLEAAAALVPQAGGGANPNALIAQIALDNGDTARAVEALDAVVRIDHYNVAAARRLVELADEVGDSETAAEAVARVVSSDPFDGEAQQRFGDVQFANGNTEGAIRAFRAALAATPPDVALTYANLAEAYLQADDTTAAKRAVLQALEIAPAFEQAQDVLLSILDREASMR